MCVGKEVGDLGFGDLKFFNQIILAKQCQRLCRQLESLLFQVLRGCYFRTGSFLQAQLGSNPCYGWRSILQGMCKHKGSIKNCPSKSIQTIMVAKARKWLGASDEREVQGRLGCISVVDSSSSSSWFLGGGGQI